MVICEAKLLVDRPALGRRMERDHFGATFPGRRDAGLEQVIGIAPASCFGSGVEVEQIGANGLIMQPVRWKFHKVQAAARQHMLGAIVLCQ